MLVLRIKKIYLDKILSGEKNYEYRLFSEYYEKKMNKNPKKILFLCGKQTAEYRIENIEIVNDGGLGKIKQYKIKLLSRD